MKKLTAIRFALSALVLSGTSLFMACGEQKEAGNDLNAMKDETMAIHDEIMPQVSAFDRQSLKIDSLLAAMPSVLEKNPTIDTTALKSDLAQLKARLEGATNQMMEWMMKYELDPDGMTEEEKKAYFTSELEKVRNMRELFAEVNKEAAEKLSGL